MMYTYSHRAIRRARDYNFREKQPIPTCHPTKKRTEGRLRHYVAMLEKFQQERLYEYMEKLGRMYLAFNKKA